MVTYSNTKVSKIIIIIRVISSYVALINRAGGLYGRILTEVVKYRPNVVRSVHTTEVKILPYRPT